ncbi:enoyl-CoA hydratase/isomerase family protein [Nocardioides sp. NPDC057767]|uniref:enoyl-CoA hydratase/isomerase family protein n=1 Tax=unclassified Nocardioides TaxID=2615069 RepID=UPI00367351D5
MGASTDPDHGEVTLDHDGPVAVITLNRPNAHNAMSIRMVRQLADITAAVRADPDLRAVVITGAGDRAFSAGGDLGELIPHLTAGELEVLIPDPSKRFFSDVYVPVIAAVNGLCVAGGLEVLLGTDIRISSADAVFGLPEVKWGLIPGGGSHVRLPQQIGWPAAMHLLLTGETIDAETALRLGLINEILPPADVHARAMTVANAIAANAPIAVRTAKEIAVKALANEPRFQLETALNERVLATNDAREGPAAFMERRSPDYQNR